MRKFLFLVILNLQVLVLFAQPNYKPAYIINLRGDTIKGFIDYRNWEYNPKTIHFGLKQDNVNTSYNCNQIKGFGVEGEIYESQKIFINTNKDVPDGVSYVSDISYKQDTVFLKALLIGPKSLYYYNNADYDENFYIHEGANMVYLIHQVYIRDTSKFTGKLNSRNFLVERKKNMFAITNMIYKNQLAMYLDGCDSIKKYILTLQYNE